MSYECLVYQQTPKTLPKFEGHHYYKKTEEKAIQTDLIESKTPKKSEFQNIKIQTNLPQSKTASEASLQEKETLKEILKQLKLELLSNHPQINKNLLIPS